MKLRLASEAKRVGGQTCPVVAHTAAACDGGRTASQATADLPSDHSQKWPLESPAKTAVTQN